MQTISNFHVQGLQLSCAVNAKQWQIDLSLSHSRWRFGDHVRSNTKQWACHSFNKWKQHHNKKSNRNLSPKLAGVAKERVYVHVCRNNARKSNVRLKTSLTRLENHFSFIIMICKTFLVIGRELNLSPSNRIMKQHVNQSRKLRITSTILNAVRF